MGLTHDLSAAQWKSKVLEGNGLILLDFHATWCGPCKALAPTLEDLAKEFVGSCEIFKVDIDTEQKLAAKAGIMSVPTLILMKDGKELDRQVGALPKKRLAVWIKKFLPAPAKKQVYRRP